MKQKSKSRTVYWLSVFNGVDGWIRTNETADLQSVTLDHSSHIDILAGE